MKTPMTRLRADLLLLLAAVIWGTAFVAQKWANGSMGPLTFVSARFLLSALVLAPLALMEAKRAARPLTRRDLGTALLVGLCLVAGASLQQIALLTASATNGGFLTALYVVLIPFAAWSISREPIRPLVIAACLVCVSGAWLLTDTGAERTWAVGDLLLIASDVPWAIGIALVAVFQKGAARPLFLSFFQYSVTAVVAGTAALLFEDIAWAGIAAAGPSILYAGVISGGLAFTLQVIAQKHTPPAEAGLIMALESVFAALAGAALLGERLTPVAMMGCVLILAGVVMVEAGPALTRGLMAMLGRVR